jgi:2'-5' RNA ligase
MTRKHAVIELHLDDAAAEKLRYAWDRLEAQGIDAGMPQSGARPHVSLVVGSGLDYGEAKAGLKEVCARQGPLRIRFPYLGLFAHDPCVGFLGVAQTQDVMRLHAEIFSAVEACFEETDRNYGPPSIVLHATLALAIPKERVPAYWEVVSSLALPRKTLVEQIDLVEYFPAHVRASLPLKAPGKDKR